MSTVQAQIASIESSTTMTEVQKNIALADLKLTHYNTFLMDQKREPGVAYVSPFTERPQTVVEKIVELKAKRAEKAAKVPKEKKVKVAKAPKALSKKAQALALYAECTDKAEFAKRLIEQTGITEVAAVAWFYSSKRLSK